MYARDPGFCSLPENNERAPLQVSFVLITWGTPPMSYKVDISVTTHRIHAPVDCVCGMYRVHSETLRARVLRLITSL